MIEHNKGVLRTRVRFLRPRSVTIMTEVKLCLKLCCTDTTTEANSIKLYRNMKDNEYVCRAQILGFFAQGQAYIQVTGQNCISAINQKLLKQI